MINAHKRRRIINYFRIFVHFSRLSFRPLFAMKTILPRSRFSRREKHFCPYRNFPFFATFCRRVEILAKNTLPSPSTEKNERRGKKKSSDKRSKTALMLMHLEQKSSYDRNVLICQLNQRIFKFASKIVPPAINA